MMFLLSCVYDICVSNIFMIFCVFDICLCDIFAEVSFNKIFFLEIKTFIGIKF